MSMFLPVDFDTEYDGYASERDLETNTRAMVPYNDQTTAVSMDLSSLYSTDVPNLANTSDEKRVVVESLLQAIREHIGTFVLVRSLYWCGVLTYVYVVCWFQIELTLW